MDKKLAIQAQVSFYTTFQNTVPGPSTFQVWLDELPVEQQCALLNCYESGDNGWMGDTLLVKINEYYVQPWA